MRHAGFATLLLGSLVLSAPAQAKRPSYSYFEAAYLNSEVDAGEGSDGVRAALGVSMNRWLYFTAGYDHLDAAESDVQADFLSAGLGLHSLNSKFQVFGAATYERVDVTSDALGGADDDGYGIQLGARLPIDLVELQADYKYVNYGELADGSRNDEDRYRFGALAHLTRTFALTASYEMYEQNEDIDRWTVGLRAYFNNRHDQPRKRKRRAPEAPAESVEQEPEAQ